MNQLQTILFFIILGFHSRRAFSSIELQLESGLGLYSKLSIYHEFDADVTPYRVNLNLTNDSPSSQFIISSRIHFNQISYKVAGVKKQGWWNSFGLGGGYGAPLWKNFNYRALGYLYLHSTISVGSSSSSEVNGEKFEHKSIIEMHGSSGFEILGAIYSDYKGFPLTLEWIPKSITGQYGIGLSILQQNFQNLKEQVVSTDGEGSQSSSKINGKLFHVSFNVFLGIWI